MQSQHFFWPHGGIGNCEDNGDCHGSDGGGGDDEKRCFLGLTNEQKPTERQSSFHLELVTVDSDADIFEDNDNYICSMSWSLWWVEGGNSSEYDDDGDSGRDGDGDDDNVEVGVQMLDCIAGARWHQLLWI